MEKIIKIRESELGWLWNLTFTSTGWGFLFTTFPLCLILIVFSYYANDTGRAMDVITTYKALAFINSLTFPLLSLPGSIAGILGAKVTLKKKQKKKT